MPTDPDLYLCLNRGTCGGKLPTEDFARVAADAGFAGADVDLGYARANGGASALADLYAKHGLRFGGWGLGDWRSADKAKSDASLEDLKALAPIAAELKADSCATWLMPSSDLPLMDNWRFHVERLKPQAQVLADHGLRLGLEFVAPHHLRRKSRHEFVFTPGLMLELAADVGPNVGLLVDCFHVHCAGVPMSDVADLPREKVVLAHLNDAPEGQIWDVNDGVRLLPGEGAIDAAAFLSALRDAGYAGPVSLEVFSDDLRALPPEEAAERAFDAAGKFF